MDKTDAVNPAHYRQYGVECIEITRHLPFAVGNAVKYLWRHREKNGAEDLRKAAWYINDAVENVAQDGYGGGVPKSVAERFRDAPIPEPEKSVIWTLVIAANRINNSAVRKELLSSALGIVRHWLTDREAKDGATG